MLEEHLKSCGWDKAVAAGGRFRWRDDGDPHGVVWLIFPDNTCVGLGGACEGTMDESRCMFIAEACNAMLPTPRID